MTQEEAKEYKAEQRRLRSANYHLTDNREIMCRVCKSGQLISSVGIRICHANIAFVTCGGTCDSFQSEVKN